MISDALLQDRVVCSFGLPALLVIVDDVVELTPRSVHYLICVEAQLNGHRIRGDISEIVPLDRDGIRTTGQCLRVSG